MTWQIGDGALLAARTGIDVVADFRAALPAATVYVYDNNSRDLTVQVAAAALVSENKILSHPASVDSIPTSADKEDHVSMGAWASRKAARVVTNSRRVLAMELIAAAQGFDLRRPLRSGPLLEAQYGAVRELSPPLGEDRSIADEAFAGDVVGLPNHGQLRIGDTRRHVTRNAVQLSGTPSSALGLPAIPSTARFPHTLPTFLIAGYQQLGSPANSASAVSRVGGSPGRMTR